MLFNGDYVLQGWYKEKRRYINLYSNKDIEQCKKVANKPYWKDNIKTLRIVREELVIYWRNKK